MPNSSFHSLPGFSTDLIRRHLRPTRLAHGKQLFAPGGQIENVYFLERGAVSLIAELENGRSIEWGILGSGNILGGGAVLNDREATYGALVQVEGECLALDVNSAKQIGRYNESFRTIIARHEQLILAQAQQSAACNATHNLNQRLARWLLSVQDATGSDNFKVTQDLMAMMLGVGRTSVSIIAHGLQLEGLLNYRRGSVHITNKEGLEQIACECYRAVRRHQDDLRKAQAPATTPPLLAK